MRCHTGARHPLLKASKTRSVRQRLYNQVEARQPSLVLIKQLGDVHWQGPHREEDVEKLAGGGDERVHQRPKVLDGVENKQLPQGSTGTEEQQVIPGLHTGD